MIPVYLSTISLLLLLVSVVWNSKIVRTRLRKIDPEEEGGSWDSQAKSTTIGSTTRILDGTRLASLVLLFGLSVAAFIRVKESHHDLGDWRLDAAQCALYVRSRRVTTGQNTND